MSIELDITQISKVLKDFVNYDNLVFKLRAANVLDMGESEKMWGLLNTLSKGGVKYVVMDMHDLEFIDSAGIGVLINAAKLLRMNKGDIVMMSVSSRIESIFNPIRLQRFIKIFSNMDECVRHFHLL